MPSYRPQANASQPLPASSRAMAWVNRSPEGLGTSRVGTAAGRSRAARPVARTASRASLHGSGRITIPAPPPAGASSTVRCRSWVKSRRSWTARSSMPLRRALPIRESSSGARYSGKIVTTSIRSTGSVTGLGEILQQPCGCRHHDPATLDVNLGNDRRDEGHQPVTGPGGTDDEQILGSRVLDGDHLAEPDPGRVDGDQAHE